MDPNELNRLLIRRLELQIEAIAEILDERLDRIEAEQEIQSIQISNLADDVIAIDERLQAIERRLNDEQDGTNSSTE